VIPHQSLEMAKSIDGENIIPTRVYEAWAPVAVSTDFSVANVTGEEVEGGQWKVVSVEDIEKLNEEVERVNNRRDEESDFYRKHSNKLISERIVSDRRGVEEEWLRTVSASGGEVLHEDEAEKELQQLRVSEEIERMRKRMLGCATREDEDMRVVSDSDCEKMCREHIDQEVAAVDVESGIDEYEESSEEELSISTSSSSTLITQSSFRRQQQLSTLISELNTASKIVYHSNLPEDREGVGNYLRMSMEAGWACGTREFEGGGF
jgi:hypothetical protein